MRKPSGCSCSSARCASRLAVRARIGTALTAFAEKPRSSSTAAIGMETFIVSGRPHAAVTASRSSRARSTCGPLTPRSSASSRIRSARGSSGRCRGWPKPGILSPEARTASVRSRATAAGSAPVLDLRLCLFEQQRARLRRAEDHRARSQDPRGDRALERAGIGGQGHPRGDVRRHHPVLGDRDQQHIEEEALVIGRLAAGEQQVEVLGEAEPPHEVAGEVAPAHLDPVGIGLADAADGGAGLADLHAARR